MASIGIGIPFFNAEKYLDFAVRSVINQSFMDWELYLVDDGSTDNSLEIARKYVGDKRVHVISDSTNRGLVYRLNQITALLNTKYLARMDADDIMHPDRLKIQFEFLESNPDIDVVGAWAYSIDVNNQIHGLLKNNTNPTTSKEVVEHLCFIHPSVMGKRIWFINNSYTDLCPRLEDMELWCRTIDFSSFRNIPEALLFYREVGVPYLSKYLMSMKGERHLINRTFKSFKRVSLLLRNYLKCAVYTVVSILHAQDILIKNRSLEVSKQNLSYASEALSCAVK